jgi:hypothetical protein
MFWKTFWKVIYRGCIPIAIGVALLSVMPYAVLEILLYLTLGVIAWACGAFVMITFMTIVHFCRGGVIR